MIPYQLAKVKALLIKKGYKESGMPKNWFFTEDGSDRAADLRKDNPIIGILISGNIVTSGHGNLKVEDDIAEVEAIMKSKTIPTSKSPVIAQEGEAQPPVTQSAKSKLGAGDTHVSKTTAICKDCGTSFETTLDNAQQLMAQFSELYCLKCRGKHETKTPETSKNAETKGNVPATPTKIKTCKSCGLELSGARAVECFQKDPQTPVMVCEECESKYDETKHQETEKTKDATVEEHKARPEESKVKPEQKENNMDEKLPETIKETDNKLTVNTIKQYICPAATDAEAYNFLQLCLHRDLNPFLKEAYLIKYGSAPATMVVGKDAFIRKAAESGQYDGFEAGIIIKSSDGKIERREGVVQYEGDILVGGWAKVFRKDMKHPFVCEVPLTEYMKYKDGKPQSSWGIMPGTMIRKVAVVQAHREAFAKELGGCYDAVEMGTQDNIK